MPGIEDHCLGYLIALRCLAIVFGNYTFSNYGRNQWMLVKAMSHHFVFGSPSPSGSICTKVSQPGGLGSATTSINSEYFAESVPDIVLRIKARTKITIVTSACAQDRLDAACDKGCQPQRVDESTHKCESATIMASLGETWAGTRDREQ
jgi:hypothetical protein